ncbi:MAG: hypothetical protein AB7U20_04605 [Planctomycetaceae bacterium]
MARRRRSDEIAFGSDSFLDIVANIVGILIILIVIAGVRVSQTPLAMPGTVSVATDDEETVAEAEPAPSLPPVDLPPDDLPPSWRFPVQAAAAPEPIDQPPLPEPPTLAEELVEEVAEREQELKRIEQRRKQLAAQEAALTAEQKARRLKLDETRQREEELRTSLDRGRLTVSTQHESLEAKQRELAALQVTLADAETQQPSVTVLKHRLTPVGRKVDGKEVHFLLSRGRVAVVPIEELAEELKRHLLRKRDDILRTQRYVGSVGPIQGFRMDYVVERLTSSLIEELRMGQAIIRSGLTEFQIRPDPGVITEAVEQALHPHGRFLAALRRAGPDATLTFWVYPDSFALHRELQDFAHDQGFEVAARPLPEGIPITGSPQGSRSVAQ